MMRPPGRSSPRCLGVDHHLRAPCGSWRVPVGLNISSLSSRRLPVSVAAQLEQRGVADEVGYAGDHGGAREGLVHGTLLGGSKVEHAGRRSRRQRGRLPRRSSHDLGRQRQVVEGGLVGVHLVAGRVRVDEQVADPRAGGEGDLAPGEHVRLQARGSAHTRGVRLAVVRPAGGGHQLRVGQVLAVEPLLGQAQAGAVDGEDPVSVAVLDALDAEDRGRPPRPAARGRAPSAAASRSPCSSPARLLRPPSGTAARMARSAPAPATGEWYGIEVAGLERLLRVVVLAAAAQRGRCASGRRRL